jgi:hypothetical protein
MKYKMCQFRKEIAVPYKNICGLYCTVNSFLKKIGQGFPNMYIYFDRCRLLWQYNLFDIVFFVGKVSCLIVS